MSPSTLLGSGGSHHWERTIVHRHNLGFIPWGGLPKCQLKFPSAVFRAWGSSLRELAEAGPEMSWPRRLCHLSFLADPSVHAWFARTRSMIARLQAVPLRQRLEQFTAPARPWGLRAGSPVMPCSASRSFCQGLRRSLKSCSLFAKHMSAACILYLHLEIISIGASSPLAR